MHSLHTVSLEHFPWGFSDAASFYLWGELTRRLYKRHLMHDPIGPLPDLADVHLSLLTNAFLAPPRRRF